MTLDDLGSGEGRSGVGMAVLLTVDRRRQQVAPFAIMSAVKSLLSPCHAYDSERCHHHQLYAFRYLLIELILRRPLV